MADLRQSHHYAKYLENIGWKVEKIQGTYVFIKKFPILGNFLKIQRPEKLNSAIIDYLIEKYKPWQIIIEPKNNEQERFTIQKGFKQSKNYFIPTKTIQVDLKKTEEKLLAGMKKETRYSLRKSLKNRLKVSVTNEINTFAEFWQKCAMKQRGMFISQKKEIMEIYKAFGNRARIILITNREILAGILMVGTTNTAYYMYAASTHQGKKLFAPTRAVWETIKLSKKLKYRIFDFEGIYDERFPVKSWKGFSQFKKSFGGKELEHPGTYHKYLLPF